MIPQTSRVTNPVYLGAAARLVVGLLLIAAATVAWKTASVADMLARRHESIATLRPEAAASTEAPQRWIQPLLSLVDRDAAAHPTTIAYWRRDYAALTDPARVGREPHETLLATANAAFRRAQIEAAGAAPTPGRLDQVLQSYATVLKNHGFDRDAAYNFEYVARLRDAAARAKPAASKADNRAARDRTAAPPRRDQTGGLPVGPTIHGRSGTHPPATRGEEFEILTPMNFGDREAQPEPTPGVRLPKKG